MTWRSLLDLNSMILKCFFQNVLNQSYPLVLNRIPRQYREPQSANATPQAARRQQGCKLGHTGSLTVTCYKICLLHGRERGELEEHTQLPQTLSKFSKFKGNSKAMQESPRRKKKTLSFFSGLVKSFWFFDSLTHPCGAVKSTQDISAASGLAFHSERN